MVKPFSFDERDKGQKEELIKELQERKLKEEEQK